MEAAAAVVLRLCVRALPLCRFLFQFLACLYGCLCVCLCFTCIVGGGEGNGYFRHDSTVQSCVCVGGGGPSERAPCCRFGAQPAALRVPSPACAAPQPPQPCNPRSSGGRCSGHTAALGAPGGSLPAPCPHGPTLEPGRVGANRSRMVRSSASSRCRVNAGASSSSTQSRPRWPRELAHRQAGDRRMHAAWGQGGAHPHIHHGQHAHSIAPAGLPRRHRTCAWHSA